MNKIYRLVWNASQRAWVVAGEFATAKGKGKGGTTRRALIRAGGLSGAFVVALFSVEPAKAWMVNPTYVVNPGAGTSDGGRASNVAIGWAASATGSDYAIAIGTLSEAREDSSIAIGAGAKALSGYGTAIGRNAVVSGDLSTALGVSATASGVQSAAVGNNSQAIGALSSAIGSYAKAEGMWSSAIGYETSASGGQSLAMGASSIASGNYSSALGAYSRATGGGTSAVGIAAKAYGENSTAIGYGAVANGRDSISIGRFTVSENSDGGVESGSAKASTAIGTASRADQDYSVALGAESQTSALVSTSTVVFNGATKSVAGATAAGTVSIGGGGDNNDKVRTITNVAAGRVSATSTDAINGSELFALGDTPLTFTGNSGTVDKRLGNTLNIQGTSATAGTYSGNNLKTVVDASGVMQLQMADNPVVNSVIATDGTNTSTLAANGLTVTGGPSVTTTGINAGGQKVTNVAAGDISATSTDAINGSQLKATNDQVTNNTTNIANNTTNINGLKDDALQWDATLNAYSANHMGSGTAKITNVAAGDLSDISTDAVNGSQLYATNEQVTTNTTNIAANTTNINGLKDDALQWDATLNAYSANHMGSGTAKITNVAAGELSDTSTDAVNGSQLKETNDQVT
ncbi:ESPR-type extended signal peptide-containing protein, partial [Serratia fonticola]